MSELKVGGLALIIKCKQDPRNVGKCVRLERFVRAGEDYVSPRGKTVNNGSGFDVFIVTGDLAFDGYKLPGGDWLQKSPHTLMPLDGDPDSVVINEKELAIS